MEQLKKYPKIPGAFLMVVLFLVIQIVFGIVGAIFNVGNNALNNPLALGILNIVSIGILIDIGLKKNKISFKDQFPFRPIKIALVIPMILTVFGLSILVSEADNLVNTILPMPSSLKTLFGNLMTSPWGFIVLVLIAPISEELLFRGLILDSFLTNYGIKTSVIVSSLVFGLFHFSPWQFVGPIIVGIIFAWWYVKTKSLLACMLGHSIFNALPVLFYSADINIPGYSSGYAGNTHFQPLWFDIIGLLSFMLGVFILLKMFKKYEKQDVA